MPSHYGCALSYTHSNDGGMWWSDLGEGRGPAGDADRPMSFLPHLTEKELLELRTFCFLQLT